jgi:hypothetical protein
MLVHPIVASEVSESTVVMSKVYPLVRELVHKYKLKVMGKRISNWNPSEEYSHFYLARDDGFVVGTVGINREGQYTFRTGIRPKDRGRTREDKMTYMATKVSSMMRSIEKNKLLPENTVEVMNYLGHTREVVKYAIKEYDYVGKNVLVNGAELHDILKVVFGYQDAKNLPISSMEKFKKVLDEYNQVDETRQAKLNVVKEKFDKPIKFIAYDDTKTFLKGTMKLSVSISETFNLDRVSVDEIECKRVRTFMDDTDIAPLMAMFKVKLQQTDSSTSFMGEEGFFPECGERHVEELGIVKVDTDGWRHDNYPSKPQWIFFV